MKPYGIIAPLLGVFTLACHAADIAKPDAAQEAAAITKGLGFLAKEGDAWVAKEKCMACHHLPMILWSHGEALRRCFPVDAKKMDEWLKWSVTYTDAKGGPEVLGLWLLASLPAPYLEVPDTLKPAALTKFLLATQQRDGSWKPTGRLGKDQRRSAAEAQEFVTRLTMLALAKGDATDEKTAAARERALTWLKQDAAPQSTETFLFRALMAQQSGKLEEAGALFKDLLRQQHPDGGWAWRSRESTSDAYTTGLALYALHGVQVEHAAETAERARRWLLAAQREDGAWPVDGRLISAQTSANDLKMIDAIYTTWATSWAVIALLQDFPVVDAGPTK